MSRGETLRRNFGRLRSLLQDHNLTRRTSLGHGSSITRTDRCRIISSGRLYSLSPRPKTVPRHKHTRLVHSTEVQGCRRRLPNRGRIPRSSSGGLHPRPYKHRRNRNMHHNRRHSPQTSQFCCYPRLTNILMQHMAWDRSRPCRRGRRI